mmetsp:Transcript_13296/g.31568  ORF Transcript_13296/g.31568 Transcript_13296/m.31568 type:complete len:201 (+) Transcript_13296:93-695(+)|eukprot:CAMPEP_0181455286 /NCGR_PEP_ID=MMETSP1110-20121109/30681_1 /TAXON_ID=174948 /ORGANISM="Symbiodinium sp., Strain CCMP421" /LENGTH=200 /DNA_ID=CAMNT_0023579669 /DNA_START=93 /DNA_END=695 /DNA_ORIENTATION=-
MAPLRWKLPIAGFWSGLVIVGSDRVQELEDMLYGDWVVHDDEGDIRTMTQRSPLSLLQKEQANQKTGAGTISNIGRHLENNEESEESEESFDDDIGMPVPKIPDLPTTMYSKLKAELASDGPVETSIKETDEAGDATMKDAKEWRETEKELQQATEDLGKASHKAAKDLQQGTKQLQKGRSRAAQKIEQELDREDDNRDT